jgi:tRNA1Val (adenine37-N6)-methyltransferase
MYHADVRCWDHDERYDLVLCNPPFYKGHQASNDARAAVAKHEKGLGLDALMREVDDRCMDHGRACMIIPVDRLEEFLTLATAHGFHLSRKCLVHYLSNRSPKRVLVEFSRKSDGQEEASELVIEQTPGDFSPEYRALLSDLELHF